MSPIPPGRPAQVQAPSTIGRRQKKLGQKLLESTQLRQRLLESTQVLVESTQLIDLRP
jgi:hypothetical protein